MRRSRLDRIGSWLLGSCAAYQVFMGAYFVAVRPPLIPEDERAIGMTLVEAQRSVPGLVLWLDRVFAVLGGQAVAVGLLAGYIVWATRGKRVSNLAIGVVAGAGLFSVFLMSGMNFLIHSDFRWALVAPAAAWLLGLMALRSAGPRRSGPESPSRLLLEEMMQCPDYSCRAEPS
jgi:hypothetical protein